MNNLKAIIRKQMIAKLKTLTQQEKQTASDTIIAAIRDTKEWQQAKHIAIFYPLANEPQILDLAAEKNCALPIVLHQQMEFHHWQSGQPLHKSPIGIHEPARSAPIDPAQLDLIIIPGLAFDRLGNRLGRGAGYYDRFLSKHVGIQRIGVAFSCQIIDQVPHEPHDIQLHNIFFA